MSGMPSAVVTSLSWPATSSDICRLSMEQVPAMRKNRWFRPNVESAQLHGREWPLQAFSPLAGVPPPP